MNPPSTRPIAWLVASLHAPPVRPEVLRQFGPVWGGWRVWPHYHCDHIVCVDPEQAAALIQESVHTVATLHIPSSMPAELKATPGVKVFVRPTTIHQASNPELVSLFRLAALASNTVYLLGLPDEFVLSDRAAISAVVASTPAVQWVQLNNESMFLAPESAPNYSQSDLQQVLDTLKKG